MEHVRSGAKESAKLLGTTAFMAAVFAPHAANHAIETTKVEASFGEFPIELSYQPDTSSLDILNAGKIYVKKAKHGIGIQAAVTGIPTITSSDPLDLISNERIKVYSGLATDSKDTLHSYRSELVSATIDNALDYAKYPVLFGGIALYLLGSTIASKNKLRAKEGEASLPATKLTAVGAASVVMAASLAAADYDHQEWRSQHPLPTGTVQIDALSGTFLDGATTDPQLNDLTRSLASSVMKLHDRRSKGLHEYLAVASPKLQEELIQVAPPRQDEELLFIMTDMHGSIAGTQLAKEAIETLHTRFGKDRLKNVLNTGDMVYDPEIQRGSIRDQADLNPSGNVILVAGNHDTGNAQQYAKDDGMTVLDGEKTVGGMSFYGKPDPMQTPIFAASSYPNPKMTEKELGEQAFEATSEHPVDVVALHQPAAAQALMNIPNFKKFIEASRSLAQCDPTEDVRDIHAGLISTGHWHIDLPVQIICNSDGSWTVINNQGTGGGANPAGTINNWSDPSTRPQENISFRIFYRNTKHGSFTGYASIVISPNGEVQPIIRHDIGTPTGTPFQSINQAQSSPKNKSDRQSKSERAP